MADKNLHSRGPTNNDLNTDGIKKLIHETRANAQFFHDLVWDTEKTIAQIDYLTRQEKANILSLKPENVIVGLVGAGRGVTPIEVCGVSCGGSCGGTCAASCAGSCGASCGGSCENSCAGTCGGSCGASCGNSCAGSCAASCVASGDRFQFDDFVTLPGESVEQTIIAEIRVRLNPENFSRFQR
jgi:hypothetical protein